MDHYAYGLDDFKRIRPDWEYFTFADRAAQSAFFAEDLLSRLDADEAAGRRTVVVLPVGPIDYAPFVAAVNERGRSLAGLVVFFMDEYCNPDGSWIDVRHPLSFRGFAQRTLVSPLREELRIPEDQFIFPNGADPDETLRAIERFGGIDVTYGGFGVNGHLAFNDPPEDPAERTERNVRDSTVRVVTLSRETLTQNAMGGTGGNMDLIPRQAATLGMRELLSAGELHLYLLRTWHAGILRKALFGPVGPECPGSYAQTHPWVRLCMTADALAPPAVNVTLNIGA